MLLVRSMHVYGQNLSDIAASARAHGQTSVVIRTSEDEPAIEQGSQRSAQQIIKAYSIVEVVPIKEYVETTSSDIRTWYALRVVHILNRSSGCVMCDHSLTSPPQALLPVPSDTLFVPVPGGSALIDGVRITKITDASVKLQLGTRYLMFVKPVNPDSAVHMLTAGLSGVYRIENNGKLMPASKSDTGLSQNVKQIGTLQSLRAFLRKH
jgi:hypothetical protein